MESFRHYLHGLDLGLKLQLLLQGEPPNIATAGGISAAQAQQRPDLRQSEAALLGLLDELNATQCVPLIACCKSLFVSLGRDTGAVQWSFKSAGSPRRLELTV